MPHPALWRAFHSHIRSLPVSAQGRIQQAFMLMLEAHGAQKRKSGEPYVVHPIAVAHLLADMGADEETLIAALLHDTIEDTPLTLREVEQRFGKDVRMLVDGVTKIGKEHFRRSPTLDDQTETLRKMFTLMQEDVRIMVIKLVDRVHNMQTVDFLAIDRQQAYAKETMEVYVKIADRLCMQDLRDELGELSIRILEPELFEQLLRLRIQNENMGIPVMETLSRGLRMAATHLPVDLRYEHKRWRTLRTQLKAGGSAATGISDLNVVCVCEDIPGCYALLGSLHQGWQREKRSFEDLINSPDLNGYQGLHTTIILEDGTRARCKIRTRTMHEYARKGIACRCFDQKAIGALMYLPWAQRISPLSEDTKDRSNEFWESLQSDILGDSITVHGADDRAILLPADATALDGAFYLRGEKALGLKSVKIDGAEESFQSPLGDGTSLAFEIGSSPQVSYEWLQWVRTGLAQAQIRAGLRAQPTEKKHEIGRRLLEEEMRTYKNGLLAEFKEESLLPKLSGLGFSSLVEACVGIAEGRVEAQQVYRVLFEDSEKSKGNTGKKHAITVRFAMQRDDSATLRRLVDVYEQFNISLRTIRSFGMPFSSMRRFTLNTHLSHTECEQLKHHIEMAGGKCVESGDSFERVRYACGVGLLLLLWGIDPVVARLLVTDYAIAPMDLTLIRFWSLTLLCACLLVAKTWRKRSQKEVAIPLRNLWLWFSACMLVVVALAGYAALQFTWPSHYTIPMTAAGLVLTSIQNAHRWTVLLPMWALFGAGVAVLVFSDPTWTVSGMLLTLVTVLSFTLFSVVSEYYKRQEHVQGRALQYFFVLSLLCALISLPLVAYTTIGSMPLKAIVASGLFSIFVSALPYYLYYYALSRRQIDFVLRYSFLIIFASVGAQGIIYKQLNVSILVAGLLVILGALLPLVWREQQKA